jgi:hypothetical protein
MNKLSATLSVFGLAFPFYCAEAATHLESYLPHDTAIVASVPDYASALKKSDESPVHDLVNDPKLKEILKPLTDYVMRLTDEGSDKPIITWDEIKPHLSGQIVIGLDLSPITASIKSDGNDKTGPVIEILANLKDSDAFDELLTTRLKDQENDKNSIGAFAESDKFQGVTIRHFVMKDTTPAKDAADPDEDKASVDGEKTDAKANAVSPEPKPEPEKLDVYYGVVNGTFFIVSDQGKAHDIVDAVKGKEAGTLAEGETLPKLFAQTEEMDAYLFINARPIADLVESHIRKSLKAKPGEEPNPMKPTPEAVLSALGMSSLKNCVFGVKFEPDNVRMTTNIAVDTSYGIGRLFRAYASDYPTPDFVPEASVAVNASGFNLGTLIVEGRQIFFSALPSAQLFYQAQIGQIQQQTNVDLEKNFIENFDNGLVTFALDNQTAVKPDLGNRQQIYALKIKDAASFKRGLDAVLASTPFAAKLERRNVSGTEVIVVNNNNSTPVFSLAEKDNWLLMCPNPTSLQNVISSGDAKKNFWQSRKYTELGQGKLPAGGIAVTYDDFNSLVRTLLTGLASVYNRTSPVENGEAKPIDVKLIGEITDMPYSICGKAYKTADGITASTYLIKNQ